VGEDDRIRREAAQRRTLEDSISRDGARIGLADDSIGVEPTDTDPFDPSRSLDGA